MIDEKYKYYAFISYNREDEKWAQWLQHKLEHYKLQSKQTGRTDLPKRIRPIFKDTLELAPGNLPKQINEALAQSKHLIVICSPRSAQSEWVNKEVETFISMGKADNIIPLIIDGQPFAADRNEECFPKAILSLPEEQEILGANINEMGRDAAAVKVVAKMFDVRFDDLWQRFEREQKRRRNIIMVSSIVTIMVLAGIAFWMYLQRQAVLKANWLMMENQARYVAEKAKEEVKKGNTLDAMVALLEMIPEDGSRPFVPELEEALRVACDSLHSSRWNYRYFDESYNKMVFAGKDQYIVCEDDTSISFFDVRSMQKLFEFEIPDGLQDLPNFLSQTADTIFFMDSDYIMSYDVSDGKLIKKMAYSDTTLDLCLRSCSRIIGYQKWPWIEKWKKKVGIPADAEILAYNPQRHLALYQNYALDTLNEDAEVIDDHFLVLYNCKSRKKGINDNDKKINLREETIITDASFSPDGKYLALAYMNGTGTVIDLDSYSSRLFDCGNSSSCAHYSNCLDFGHNEQLLHSSMYDYIKIYDRESLELVDSIFLHSSLFSDCIQASLNNDGDICLISNTEDCFVYYKSNFIEIQHSNDDFERLSTTSLIYEDTILDQRYHILKNEDGTISCKDLYGESGGWKKAEKALSLNIKGYIQNNKYMIIVKEGFGDVQHGMEIVDIKSGTTVFRIPSHYYVDYVYYNKKNEQLSIGNADNYSHDFIIDFPSFENLLIYCRKVTKGMQLSDSARKRFYLL